jgi:hypothetical protein
MRYHARLFYGTTSHYWYNYEKEKIVEDLLVPFVNGHVVLITHGQGQKLLNMKNVTLLSIFKTDKILQATKERTQIQQIDAPAFSKNECTEELVKEFKITGRTQASSSLLQKSFQPPRNQAFVVMKFGNPVMDSAYEGVYKPVCESFKLRCVRIDEIQDSGKITDQILQTIAESKYVIADLSGNRPNCYYECGFAHGLGREMVLCAKNTAKVHFDLAGYRFIRWTTEADLRTRLSSRIKALENKAASTS